MTLANHVIPAVMETASDRYPRATAISRIAALPSMHEQYSPYKANAL